MFKTKRKNIVDITLIHAAPFSHHMKNLKVKISTTLLCAIECTIKKINLNKTSIESLIEAIWHSLLAKYQEFQDVFPKQAS